MGACSRRCGRPSVAQTPNSRSTPELPDSQDELLRKPFGRSSQQVPSAIGRQTLAESRAASLPRSLGTTSSLGLQVRDRVSDGVERPTSMHNRKHPTGLEFRAVLTEGGTEFLEPTKA